MAAHTMPLRCPACGMQWEIAARPDGTMPVTARCPKERGGCGKLRKVPRSMTATPSPAAPAAAAAWDPPSEPRHPRHVGEPCPHCGESKVCVSPRGTVLWCWKCGEPIAPAGVNAPYERGIEVTRAARSQHERDDDAKKTVLIAGEFLRQVRAMLDDPQVHPASADLLGWYEEEITEARKGRDGRRLAELADEFGADQEARAFRRRHWWQGQPAAITAGYADDEDDEGEDYADEDEDQDGEPAAVLATPASIAAQQHRAQPRRMTWAEGIAALGWRLSPADGTCPVVDEHGHRCGAQTTSHALANGRGGYVWLCGGHFGTLGAMLGEHNRRIAS